VPHRGWQPLARLHNFCSTQEVYAKWRLTGKEGPVLRAGYQPETGIIGVTAGTAF